MRETNYWEQFLSTGKIGDYLAYREKEVGDQENEGAGKGAGTDCCYRDDLKSRADGRM